MEEPRESIREPLVSDGKLTARRKWQAPVKPDLLRTTLFFILISTLSVSIATPGFYILTATEQYSPSHGLGLWLLVLALIDSLGLMLLTLQFCTQTVASAQFCLCSLLPVPLCLIEAAWDLAGTALLHLRDSDADPLWFVSLAVILLSCGKLWVHCCYSSTLFANGCEMVGAAVWDKIWTGKNKYGKCCVCGGKIAPGSEIVSFTCEKNHISHYNCKTENKHVCPVCLLQV